jgi:hypothetical protein
VVEEVEGGMRVERILTYDHEEKGISERTIEEDESVEFIYDPEREACADMSR